MIARSDRRLLALTSKGLGTPGPIDVQLPSDAHDQSDVYVSSYPPGFPTSPAASTLALWH